MKKIEERIGKKVFCCKDKKRRNGTIVSDSDPEKLIVYFDNHIIKNCAGCRFLAK